MNDPLIQKRLEGLERQISMYERLFQSFSSKLDHHFKKYDMLISSQQQQINILTEALFTILNDQYRYSEILRDKLSTALTSVTATHVNIPGLGTPRSHQESQKQRQQQQQHSPQHASQPQPSLQPQPQPQTAAPLSNVDAFLEDFIAPEVPMTNPVPRRAKLGSFQTKSSSTTSLAANGGSHEPDDSGNENGRFRSLDVEVPVANDSVSAAVDARQQLVRQQVQQQVQQQQQQQQQTQDTTRLVKRKHRNTNGDSSSSKKIHRSLPIQDSSSTSSSTPTEGHRQSRDVPSASSASQLTEVKYYTSRGQSKKRKVYTGNFKFFNSPQSIMDIWKEYTEGFEGQPSIKEMEQMYHVSWRREPAMNKRYHRRRVLCKAIERGLEKGFHLDEVLRMLENARIVDAERGTKHPISWICQFSHIPEMLK